ncbi:hypothetical protein [Streptomyces marianii]|uniref:Uncharacterized protein n=1 Tax=Streptomyces marianii TaxID=1817406 RepID=A0A5R9DSK0_9ACTN|nr:hypothetical protein [Streptomyces marianii]TLQ39004.1 hypothetical protein FEF34_40035 [Streptomyces marianii]
MDDATLARATITVGLDRLRDLALGDTADTEDTARALQALHHGDEPRVSVLDVLADLLDDIAARCGDDGLEAAAENLGEAAAAIRGQAGPRVHRALEAIADTV